jgi:heavy metal translocating P-type ATPase
METLIVLGAGSAYIYSLFNFRSASLHLYFDTACMLVTLLLLGKLIEAQAKNRVRRDLEGFLSLQPTKVKLCSPAWPQGRYVAIDQLGPGDTFRSGPDEVVPADGRVVQGQARLDVAAITGEPRPVAVKPGDAVVSGSRVVQGDLVVRAEQVGAEALLGQMIAVVQESLGRKTRLENRTDRLLTFFVPLIVALAAITGTVAYLAGVSGDGALVRAVTVLVITCPCALGIAIPLTRVAGISGAGRRGILVRNYEAFEQAGRIDTVVLDKTGTVTHGTWRVERIDVCDGRSEAELLSLAMGLEIAADHTVARALHAYGRQCGVAPTAIEAIRSHPDGVSGRHAGRALRIGSRAFALDAAAGGTVTGAHALSEVVLSVDGIQWAVFYFGDTVRPNMRAAVQRLKQRGWQLHLLSGDNASAVRAVADAVGIAHFEGGQLPQDKVACIRALQSQGRCVAMVGDGINDAPAMVQADLSVAVHSGAPLARQTGAITLMRDPAQMLDFLDWASQVDRKVRQNLWCALGYNMVCIPVAMAGLLSPLVAVTAMLLSSLTVIGNTLLLVRKG